ncbi:MAG: exodeoxyribonuclease-3 [Myxococcota bacterium]|jgi:exodeoxyribonuclease-3
MTAVPDLLPGALRIVSFNVNGLRARAEAVRMLWETLEPSVLLLQETKCQREQVPDLIAELPGTEQFWNPGPKAYSGTAVIVRSSAFDGPIALSSTAFDMEGRAVVLRTGKRVIIGLYMPNGGKDYEAKLDYYDALIAWVRAERDAGHEVWVTGDLNVVHTDRDIHPRERVKADMGLRPAERSRLDRLIALGLPDVHRAFHPDVDDHFTWWPYWRGMREKNRGWRIDYHLVSPGFGKVIQSTIHRPATGSDHAPIVADVEIAHIS